MSRYLPEDVLIKILLRLPVRSLIRFKSACKSWYALIGNPNFIAKHLNFANNNKNNNNNVSRILIKSCPNNITKKPVVYLRRWRHNEKQILIDDNDGASFLHLQDIVPFYNEDLFDVIVLGPCNGIFCLYGFPPTVLWNPALRELKALPISPFPLPPGCVRVGERAGFGLDPKINDYKVVTFFSVWHDESNDSRGPPRAEVYNLSTNSWRKIPSIESVDKELVCIGDFPLINTYVNGFFYWWISENDNPGAILSFDMGDEVFSKITAPLTNLSELKHVYGRLALFNDSLALFFYDAMEMETEKCLEMWVMNKQGSQESWTKQFVVGPLPGVQNPLGFARNGALFMESSDGELLLYDPEAQELKNLLVYGCDNSLQVAFYVESLVSLKAGAIML